jgi:hypothetical protein
VTAAARWLALVGCLTLSSHLSHAEPSDTEPVIQRYHHSVRDYIWKYSRYPAKADCVAWRESSWGRAMFNPIPWGALREHAQGFFGWLPSTFRSVADWWMKLHDLESELIAFDRMLDAGRGSEFFSLGGYRFVDGTGEYYRWKCPA